jgi:hypothetical protein
MRNTKPPLLFWQGIASTGWGRRWTLWDLRYPSLVYTLLTALLVFLLGSRLSGRRGELSDGEGGLWIWVLTLFLVFAVPSQRSSRYLLPAMRWGSTTWTRSGRSRAGGVGAGRLSEDAPASVLQDPRLRPCADPRGGFPGNRGSHRRDDGPGLALGDGE